MTRYVTLDNGMVAFSPEDATISAIIQSKQYKIRIRRYVSSTEPNVYFNLNTGHVSV